MTAAELRKRMSQEELRAWPVFWKIEFEDEEKEIARRREIEAASNEAK